MNRERSAEHGSDPGPARPAPSGAPPGKRTLVDAQPIQRKVATSAPAHADDGAVHAAAERGTATAGSALPYAGSIQRLFGRHDVSGIRAHVGDEAGGAARAMGAQAYATGDHVVFDGAPDLHTAAHEAAHVVQQRAGVHLKRGVGEAGDAYEAHADRVADLVVQGRSAEPVLDEMAGARKAGAATAVQHKLQTEHGVLEQTSDRKLIDAYVGKYGEGNPVREQIIRSAIDEPDRLFTEEELSAELIKSYNSWLEVVGGKPRTQKPEHRQGLITSDEQGGARLNGWFAEPAAFKEQTGDDKHRQLLGHVIQDLRGIQAEVGKLKEAADLRALQDALVERLPAVLLYLVHNSSHDPPRGLAKVQGSEAKQPLYYFRSQSKRKHPHELFYYGLISFIQTKVLASVSGPTKKARGVDRLPKVGKQILPSEPAMQQLTGNNVGSGAPLAVATDWSSKTVDGRPLFYTSTGNYKGDTAAQVGMRKSNAQVYSDGLASLFAASGSLSDGIGNLIEFLIDYYHAPVAPTDKLPPTEQLGAELSILCGRLDKLEATHGGEDVRDGEDARGGEDARRGEASSSNDNNRVSEPSRPNGPSVGGPNGSVFDESLEYRGAFSGALARVMSKVSLAQLRVFTSEGHPNLAIQTGAPPLTSGSYNVAASYHEEGWTNAVLSFFGGLLNHFAAARGQAVYVTRRQSFGFLRPTLTDTKESFRLSLGAQPVGYAEVILEALCHLDAAISSLSPEIATKAFVIVEAKGKDGDRVMRYLRSDELKALAYATAQQFAIQGPAGFNGFLGWIANRDLDMGGDNVRADAHSRLTPDMPKAAPELAPLLELAKHNTAEACQAFRELAPKLPALGADVIGDVLRGVLSLTNRKLKEYGSSPSTTMPETQQWTLARLANGVHKGLFVLGVAPTNAAEEATRFSKATLVIEDLLENLLALSVVGVDAARSKGKATEAETAEAMIGRLLCARYKLPSGLVHVYHTGSGQQGGAATVYAAVEEYRAASGKPDKLGSRLGLEVTPNDPYFEFDTNHMLGNSMLTGNRGPAIGEVMDIHPYPTSNDQSALLGEHNRVVARLKLLADQRKADHSAAYTLAVDVTNCDVASPKIAEAIEAWRAMFEADPGLRLVLFGSLLKNEELGLDKHQAGRVIVLGADLPQLTALDQATRHPLVDEMLVLVGQLRDLRARHEASSSAKPPSPMPPSSSMPMPPSSMPSSQPFVPQPFVPQPFVPQPFVPQPFVPQPRLDVVDMINELSELVGGQLNFLTTLAPTGLTQYIQPLNASGQQNNCLVASLAMALGANRTAEQIGQIGDTLRSEGVGVVEHGYLDLAALPRALTLLGAGNAHVAVIEGAAPVDGRYNAEVFHPGGGTPYLLVNAQQIHFGSATLLPGVAIVGADQGGQRRLRFVAQLQQPVQQPARDPRQRDDDHDADEDADDRGRSPRRDDTDGKPRKRKLSPSPTGGPGSNTTTAPVDADRAPERKHVKLAGPESSPESTKRELDAPTTDLTQLDAFATWQQSQFGFVPTGATQPRPMIVDDELDFDAQSSDEDEKM